MQVLVQDKGGPSKGGFLNNRSFSYTDLYLCDEINGTCIQIIHYSGKSSNNQETTFTRTTFVLHQGSQQPPLPGLPLPLPSALPAAEQHQDRHHGRAVPPAAAPVIQYRMV